MTALRPRLRAHVLLPLLLVLACGDNAKDPTDPDPNPEGIGPAGGTVVSDDDVVALQIAPGALDEETSITIEPAAAAPAHDGLVDGTAYDFGPDGLDFAIPALLTIHYDPSELPAGSSPADLRIARANGMSWTLLPSSTNTVDASVSAVINGFSTYAILLEEEDDDNPPPAGIDASVVDAPDAAWQFTDVAPAVTYACHNHAEPTAVVELRTNRVLELDSLVIPCALRFVIAGGHTPRMTGSQGGVTHIRAGSDLDISTLPIDGDAGLVVLIAGHLRMVGLQVDGPIDVHVVEAVGTAGPGSASRARIGGGAEISDVSSGVSFGLHLDWGIDADHEFDLQRVEAPSVQIDGSGYLGAGAVARVSQTIAQELKVDLELRAAARFEANGNVNLALLDGSFDVQGDHELRLEGNAAAEAKLEFRGLKATVAMTANTFTDGTIRTSVQDLTIEAGPQAFEQLGLELFQDVLKPSLRYNQNGGTIEANLTLTAVDVQAQDAYFGLDLDGVVVGGNVVGQLKSRAGLRLTDLIAVDIQLELEGDSSLVSGTGLRASGKVDLTFGPLTARGEVQQSDIDVGRMLVRSPASTEVKVLLDVGQAAGFIYDVVSGGGAPPRVAASGAPSSAGDSIIIRDVTIDTPDDATAGILISHSDEPVLIERVTVDGQPPAILVEQAQGDVTVRGSRFTLGSSIALVMNGIAGTLLLESDTITGGPGMGMMLAGVSEAELHDMQVEIDGGGMALLASATPDLLVEGGEYVVPGGAVVQINDDVDLSVDGATMRAPQAIHIAAGTVTSNGATYEGHVVLSFAAHGTFTGNTFVGFQSGLHDGNLNGGLYANALGANTGLDGNDMDGFSNYDTFVDFDGNGCADYPVSRNLKDDEGNCGADGVPVPSP